ncbi:MULTISPECIES: thioesterase II family protein [Bacillus]|uniref:thioesterase II family protein n=1 Tax=Bacillus TaxID=1386 RepID=UPI0023DC5C66|nr:thioesterase domain-containing protein [Bacillus pseudomycoides]MDF2086168.1 thioesterase domain-containing protein [Bacillus pseudomycoides]
MDKIRLFCFPYAGGSSNIYMKWKKYLANSIELCPIELAGRGKRYSEPLNDSIEEIVDDIYEKIKLDVDQSPYMLYGHSMGSLIAFELSHKLQSSNHISPLNIFLSGRKAPQFNINKKSYQLSNDEFKELIYQIGGTSKEILNDPNFSDLFLPILRSDFKAVETYVYKEKFEKLNSDLSLMIGKEDEIDINEIIPWRELTRRGSTVYRFNGGHFFIHENTVEITNIINKTANDFIKASGSEDCCLPTM